MVTMIFKPAARYPADPRAVFILALSVFAGGTALVLREAPDSLRGVMPEWAVFIWGALLAVGSLVTLVGMKYQSVNGILTEQMGSAMVAAATIFYSAVVFKLVGPSAIQTVGLILAWGLACVIRWIQLQVLIGGGIRLASKIETLTDLEAAIEMRRAEIRARRNHARWWDR